VWWGCRAEASLLASGVVDLADTLIFVLDDALALKGISVGDVDLSALGQRLASVGVLVLAGGDGSTYAVDECAAGLDFDDVGGAEDEGETANDAANVGAAVGLLGHVRAGVGELLRDVGVEGTGGVELAVELVNELVEDDFLLGWGGWASCAEGGGTACKEESTENI